MLFCLVLRLRPGIAPQTPPPYVHQRVHTTRLSLYYSALVNEDLFVIYSKLNRTTALHGGQVLRTPAQSPPQPPKQIIPPESASFAPYDLEISPSLDRLLRSLFPDQLQLRRAMETISIEPVLPSFATRLQWKAVKGILPLPSAPVTRISPLAFSAQKLVQAVIARFNLYPDVSKKARLLDLVDMLVLACGDTSHWYLAEEGFFQTLVSDEKV